MDDCKCQVDKNPRLFNKDKRKFTLVPQILKEEDVFSVDFGAIPYEESSFQVYEIANNSNESITYLVKRNSCVNEIYQHFFFDKTEYIVCPKETRKIKILYKPMIEHEKCCEPFDIFIKEKNERFMTLLLHGSCLGPKVRCSTNKLFFKKTPTNVRPKKTFEIFNHSPFPIFFQFDLNEDDDLFKIDTSTGSIAKKSKRYFDITFFCETPGLYYRRLHCVILKHEPLILELFAGYIENEKNELNFTDLKRCSKRKCKNYLAYFIDYPFLDEENTVFSVNRNFFDFGKVSSDNDIDEENGTRILTVKNHTYDEIFIKWFTGKHGAFTISPKEVSVPKACTGFFDLQFRPMKPNQLFQKTLYGKICWKAHTRNLNTGQIEEMPTIPLSTEIILLGNSFLDQSWIAHVEIVPNILTFPPCLPNSYSFSTLTIKTNSQLPVLFKFVTPKRSNFSIKPSMGVLQNSTILVARLSSGATPTFYTEEWHLEINGKIHSDAVLLLRGLSEAPSIVVGNGNTVRFKNIVPGCYDTVDVATTNTSCHFLRVQFIGNEYVKSHPDEIELSPNKRVVTRWIFEAREACPETSLFRCSIYTIDRHDVIIGNPFEKIVEVFSPSEYSQLCCTPTRMDFGELRWGETKEFEFGLYNFGNSHVNYLLRVDTKSDEIVISKPTGAIEPNAHRKIEGLLCAKSEGEHELRIVYLTRLNKSSNTIRDSEPVELYVIKYSCVRPVLQIEEIVDHNLGHMFSKLDLWKHFAVDQTNKLLRDIREDQKKTISLVLPYFEMTERVYKIFFVLRNITKFSISASLTKIQLCSCKIYEVSKGISLRQEVFVCPHRHMLHMALSNEDVVGHSVQQLEVTLRYLAKNAELGYLLKLSDNKTLEFRFAMESVPRGVTKIKTFSVPYFKRFLNMFIGSKEPPYQSVWLYNNTAHESEYSIIEDNLKALNVVERFPVITCFKNSGIVPPYSTVPILFKFHPIEAKKYKVSVTLTLGHEVHELNLTGCGIYKYDKTLLQQITKQMPRVSNGVTNFPIAVSRDYIIVDTFPVWNCTQELLYIKNNTIDRTYKYRWKEFMLDGMIEVSFKKPWGIIKPKHVEVVVLQLKSLENPFITNINVTCELLDITQIERHKQSVKKYHEQQKVIEQYFTIDDRGYHTLPNREIIEPPPEPIYIKVDVTVHTVSLLEIFNYIEVEKQLSFTPLKEFALRTWRNFASYEPDTKSDIKIISVKPSTNSFITQVLECFIIEVLRSPVFYELLKCQVQAEPPFYLQYKTDQDQQSKQNVSSSLPPLSELSEIYKNLIRDILQQIY